jgi:hypothetical protein
VNELLCAPLSLPGIRLGYRRLPKTHVH